MNERIRELADRASEKIRYKIDPHTFKHIDDPNGPHVRIEFNKEKFAELIVRECARVAFNDWCDSTNEASSEKAILEYFGVEC